MSVLLKRTGKTNNYANSQTTQNKIETAPRVVESASVDENGKTNWKDYFGSSDFQEYSQKGNAIQNPTYEGANRGMSVGNWRPFADQVNNMVTYSRANANKIALGAANSSNVVGNLKYSDMTDDEVNMYNYLLAKENEGLLAKGTSQNFLNDIDQTLLYRQGKKQGEGIANMIKSDSVFDKIGGSMASTGTSILSGGVNAVKGISQVGNKEAVENKPIDYTAESLRKNLQDVGKTFKSGNSVGQAIFDLGYTTGNMLPSLMTGRGVGSALTGLSAGGNAKRQALQEGKTLQQANAYGALVGAFEGYLNYLLKGVKGAYGKSNLGKFTGKLSETASKQVTDTLMKASPKLAKIAGYGASKVVESSGEFIEEALQEYLEPAFRNWIFGENNNIIFDDDGNIVAFKNADALYSGILGALNSIILGVGGDIATHNSRKNAPSPNTTNQNASPSTEVQQPSQLVKSQPTQNNIHNPFVSAGLTKDVNLEEGKPKKQIPNPFVTAGLSSNQNFEVKNNINTDSNQSKTQFETDESNKIKEVINNPTVESVDENIKRLENLREQYHNSGEGMLSSLADGYRMYYEALKEGISKGKIDIAKDYITRAINGEEVSLKWNSKNDFANSKDKTTSINTNMSKKGIKNNTLTQTVDVGKTNPPAFTSETPFASQVSNDNIPNANNNVKSENAKFSQSENTTMPFTKERQQATGYTPDEYRELFKYRPMSNEESMNFAKNILFDDVGEFIGKSNPTEFAKVKQELLSKDSWTNVEVDMGHLIEQELMKVSASSDANRQSYKDWVKSMRIRAKTEVARAMQANSKWSSKGNLNGAEGRAKALETLENSNKSKADQDAIFDKATTYSSEVLANENNPEALKGIILDVANQRGTLNTPWGTKSKILDFLLNKSLNQMTTEELAQLAYNSASSLVEDVKPKDIGQIIKSVQVLNMLSSPTTPVTNIASNTTFYGIDNLAMKGAAIIDAAVAKKTGTRSVVNEKALSNKTKDAAIKGMMNSIAEITLGIDMGGGNRYGVTKGTFRANGGLLERIMHTVEIASGYALNATDEFYKGAARSTEADIQSAIDSGKIKTDDVNYAKNMANELALYRTFQNDSKIAAMLNTVHDALNVIGLGDSGRKIAGHKVGKFGLGDFASPFVKIAANLAKVAIDYSPTKAVQGTIELVKVCSGIDNATSSQAKAVSDVARGLTGIGISIVFAELAKIGIIRRADDEDEDVAKLNAAEGRQGTQINISAAERLLKGESTEWQYGDQLVDLSRLEPLNFMVNLGLIANENSDEQETIVSILKPSTNGAAMIDAMAELPVTESIGGLAKDVLKYNKPVGESLATSVGRTAISSVTPNILAAYAKGKDEYKRSVTSKDTIGEQLADYAKRRIPGLRETLPTTVDVNGNEQKEVSMSAALFNPFAPNSYTQSEVSKEMERVRKATGESNFYPTTRSQREVKYTKDGVEHVKYLDYEARQKFQKLNNQTQNREMVKLMKTGYYNEATDEEKAMMLKKCYDYAYGIAKESVLGKDAVDDWILDIKDGKIDLPNYCQYLIEINSIKGDKDANGNTISGSEKAKKLQAINSLDVSNETKDLFFKMAYPKGNYADTGWNQGKANTSSNFWKARGKS